MDIGPVATTVAQAGGDDEANRRFSQIRKHVS